MFHKNTLKILFVITLITFITGCGGGSSNKQATVNQIPTINIDSDISVNELQAIEVNVTATDKDGSIISSLWEQTSGEIVNIINPNSLKLLFESPKVLITEIQK